VSPTHGTNSIIATFALWITEKAVFVETWPTHVERSTDSTTIGVFPAEIVLRVGDDGQQAEEN